VSSNIRLFADDTVLYREINSPDDQAALQADLTKVAEWCVRNKMSLNSGKCKAMSITRLRSTLDSAYSVDNEVLEKVQEYKYLGIYITSDLQWDAHVSSICSKANQSLGFIKRQLGKCSQEVKMKAYTTLVRPHLEYAACVWDPSTNTLI